MISLTVKTSQLLPKISGGWRAQQGFYVDDSYTKGLEKCKFVSIVTGEAGSIPAPVMSYAGHVGTTYDDLGDAPIALGAGKAVGFIYETSPIDQYRRIDDQSDETRLFPKGARTDRKYAPMPSGVLEIIDLDEVYGDGSYFRTIDSLVPVTATSFDDATATIVLPGDINDIRAEENVEIDGDKYWITDVTYNDVANTTTITLNDGAGDIVLPILLKSQLFEKIYLADDMDGELPFTMLPLDGSAGARQEVGFVESGIAVRVDCRK